MWIREFLRHRLISRLAESINAARAAMSTEAVVNEFFDRYERVLAEHDLKETGSGNLP